MKWDYFLLSPLTWALLVALLLVLLWRRMPRSLRAAGIVLELLAVFLMSPLGANALVGMIEARVPAVATCQSLHPTTIVLLSGGADRPVRSAQDYAALTSASMDRLLAAVALWKRTPGARLVISGGDGRIPTAQVLANLAEQMGVPTRAITPEIRSYTTWENARDVAALSPAVPQRIWLVSSALHLPRALGAFRAWGFEPCAWPSDSLYEPPTLRLGYFLPQSSSLDKADAAVHELVGEIVYAGLEWKRRRHEPQSRPHTSGLVRPAAATSTSQTGG